MCDFARHVGESVDWEWICVKALAGVDNSGKVWIIAWTAEAYSVGLTEHGIP